MNSKLISLIIIIFISINVVGCSAGDSAISNTQTNNNDSNNDNNHNTNDNSFISISNMDKDNNNNIYIPANAKSTQNLQATINNIHHDTDIKVFFNIIDPNIAYFDNNKNQISCIIKTKQASCSIKVDIFTTAENKSDSTNIKKLNFDTNSTQISISNDHNFINKNALNIQRIQADNLKLQISANDKNNLTLATNTNNYIIFKAKLNTLEHINHGSIRVLFVSQNLALGDTAFCIIDSTHNECQINLRVYSITELANSIISAKAEGLDNFYREINTTSAHIMLAMFDPEVISFAPHKILLNNNTLEADLIISIPTTMSNGKNIVIRVINNAHDASFLDLTNNSCTIETNFDNCVIPIILSNNRPKNKGIFRTHVRILGVEGKDKHGFDYDTQKADLEVEYAS